MDASGLDAEKAGVQQDNMVPSPRQLRGSGACYLLSLECALATDNSTSLIGTATLRSRLFGVAIVLKIASQYFPLL
jgi:hypothetical protein